MKRIIITIVLAATISAFAAITMSEASSTPVRASAQRIAHRSLKDTFSVLRSAKAAVASPALPAETAKSLTEVGAETSEYGLEPARAAYVAVTPTDHGWVVPGRNGICLVLPSPSNQIYIGTTCASTTDADAGGLFTVERPSSGPPVAYGLVPNGASVTAINKDGSSTSVPITSNLFMYGGQTVRSVSIHIADEGTKTIELVAAS
jgi:type II secretory pathway pseudopilin PulG